MQVDTQGGVLYRLRESELQVADAGADIRGRKVMDAAGEELGRVDDLLIDEQERKVRFLEVAAGGFLGVGGMKVLLPVEAVIRVREDRIDVNQTRDRVAAAPRYDPDLTEDSYLDKLYGFYGYGSPFWDADYAYPRYPYL